MKRTESTCVQEGMLCLKMFAKNIEREYTLTDGLRVDLKAELPNGEFVLLECKGFDAHLAPYAEAIIQAASYADAIAYPVFVGPVRATEEEIINSGMENALGAYHALAGRLNVGFMFSNRFGVSGLVLRGKRIADARGLSSDFGSVWYHSSRRGSKWVRS